MFKKIGIGGFWVFALVFSLLNIKIYSSKVCSELNAQKIDEYANYITDRSVQNISLEEREKIVEPWFSGELAYYFHDWYIHKSEEIIFDCHSGGIPHKHCMSILVAEKK